MSKPLAIRGTYADWRLVKTRGVVQIVVEVPLSDSNMALDVLGGMPNPAAERWVAIAPIKPESEVMQSGPSAVQPIDARPEPKQDKPARAKRDWRDLPPAQQAGVRCEEPAFLRFLCEERPSDMRESNDAAECVRLICGVRSRADLNTEHAARVVWHQLNEQYEAWMRVGA